MANRIPSKGKHSAIPIDDRLARIEQRLMVIARQIRKLQAQILRIVSDEIAHAKWEMTERLAGIESSIEIIARELARQGSDGETDHKPE